MPTDPPEPSVLDQRRRSMVEIAAQVLAEDGPHGLSLRRLAALAGGSTQLVYTLFGGKPGLADALYAEGFARLAATMSSSLDGGAPAGDPERLLALGRGYLRFARAEPAFFSVMFGPAIPGFTPEPATRTAGRAGTFGQVLTAVQECLDAGTLSGRTAGELATLCWASAHGLAALEVAGLLGGEGFALFAEAALRVNVDAHRPARPLRRRRA